MTAAGLPLITPAPNGREIESMAFLRAADIVRCIQGHQQKGVGRPNVGAQAVGGRDGPRLVDVFVVQGDIGQAVEDSTEMPLGASLAAASARRRRSSRSAAPTSARIRVLIAVPS